MAHPQSTYGNRDAKFHNTLIVDGIGQLGDGKSKVWPLTPNQELSRVVSTESTPTLDHIVGDATKAYPAEAGVKKFVRHLIFFKPDILIVADDIEVKEAKKLQLLFHPEALPIIESANSYLMTGEKASLRFEVLNPDNTITSLDSQLIKSHTSKGDVAPIESLFLVVTRQAAKWRNVVALSWTKSGQQPVKVSVRKEGDKWTFLAGDKTTILNW